MSIADIVILVGGVALFLYGMSLMGDGLKKVAGTQLELILYRLSGKAVCDTDSAIDSGMYDRSSRKWISGMLKEAGVELSSFPSIVDPTEIIGTVNADAAKECGLSEGTILVGGIPDGSAAAVGTGALLLHNAVLTFGTSAGIMYTAETEGFGFKPGSFSNSAGATYNWLLDTLLGKRDYAEAERRILASPRGAGNVLFLPYLSGERSPVDDPDAKGVWYGLSRSTTMDDLFRGAVEGIIMNLSLMLKEIRAKGYTVEEMTITGGFSKSDAICQIIADVMNVTLYTLQDPDLSAAIGSAVNAGVAIGIYEDLSVVKQFLRFEKTFYPEKEAVSFYASRVESFEKLYKQLSQVFPEL